MFEQLKNFSDHEITIFWFYIFGFGDYQTTYEELFSSQSNNYPAYPTSNLRNFIIYLQRYRSKTNYNYKNFKQLDLEQLESLGNNKLQSNFPAICVLLDKKTNQSYVDKQESAVDREFISQQLTSQLEKDRESKIDKEQFYSIIELINLDVSFFQYIQLTYALICQSLFHFFKEYIRNRSQNLARTHVFSRRNLYYFAWSGRNEQNNSDSKKSFLEFKKSDEKLIDELWQNQLEKLSFFNFQGYDCSHVFRNMLERLREQIEKEELPLHIVIDIQNFPLTNLFWNCSNYNFWKYSLEIFNFTPKNRTFQIPSIELQAYYEGNYRVYEDDDEILN